jgi:hypothetical protein
MTECDHFRQVEVVLAGQHAEMIDRPVYVQVSSWPTAPWLGKSPVFNVSSRNALVFQCIGHRCEIAKTRVFSFPTSAVHEHHNRMWTISGWKAQLANLVRILTVGQPVVSGPHRQRLKIGGGHRHARHPNLLLVIAFCYRRPDTWRSTLGGSQRSGSFSVIFAQMRCGQQQRRLSASSSALRGALMGRPFSYATITSSEAQQASIVLATDSTCCSRSAPPALGPADGYEPEPSAARAATSIGLDSGPSALDALTAAFADRPFLLVVDNFEQVWANAPDIAELPARYPKPSVLATSRLPLRVRPAVGACGVAGCLSTDVRGSSHRSSSVSTTSSTG